ncbi:hypothetical protein BJV77DRAFT_351433 [Russula vinacea]|nr:hypothetical protein BJV77DRAFT_351433 [Russula vinacea]
MNRGHRRSSITRPSDKVLLGHLEALNTGIFPRPFSVLDFRRLAGYTNLLKVQTHTERSKSCPCAGALDLSSAPPGLNRPYMRNYTRLTNVYLQLLPRPYSILTVSTCPSLTSHLLPLSLPAELDNVQYAASPNVRVHIPSQSTSSTMIHFLTSFISIDQAFLTETRMIISVR